MVLFEALCVICSFFTNLLTVSFAELSDPASGVSNMLSRCSRDVIMLSCIEHDYIVENSPRGTTINICVVIRKLCYSQALLQTGSQEEKAHSIGNNSFFALYCSYRPNKGCFPVIRFLHLRART